MTEASRSSPNGRRPSSPTVGRLSALRVAAVLRRGVGSGLGHVLHQLGERAVGEGGAERRPGADGPADRPERGAAEELAHPRRLHHHDQHAQRRRRGGQHGRAGAAGQDGLPELGADQGDQGDRAGPLPASGVAGPTSSRRSRPAWWLPPRSADLPGEALRRATCPGPRGAASSVRSDAGGRTAMASAGARSVSRLTSRSWRPLSADRPVDRGGRAR